MKRLFHDLFGDVNDWLGYDTDARPTLWDVLGILLLAVFLSMTLLAGPILDGVAQ